ncbi:MAG: tRNA pseudouridine(38-40) synthase TruA [Candidatus Dormibacteria bacterium]
MPTYRMTVEYDGTDFHGWQAQRTERTVAGTLTGTLESLDGERPRITAAGRTDAGAHAHGQVVGVALARSWDPAVLLAALNALLPTDVRVVAIDEVHDRFDARRDAQSRTYRYMIMSRTQPSPVARRHVWTLPRSLDVDAMRSAAASMLGTHDFAAFGGPTNPGGSTLRTIEAIDVERLGVDTGGGPQFALVAITVRANAFLRGMMRAIAGALADVGSGKRPVAWLAQLLTTRSRPASLTVAPARGLHQWSVTYGVAA